MQKLKRQTSGPSRRSKSPWHWRGESLVLDVTGRLKDAERTTLGLFFEQNDMCFQPNPNNFWRCLGLMWVCSMLTTSIHPMNIKVSQPKTYATFRRWGCPMLNVTIHLWKSSWIFKVWLFQADLRKRKVVGSTFTAAIVIPPVHLRSWSISGSSKKLWNLKNSGLFFVRLDRHKSWKKI